MFRKVLVANRGEIARRVFKTCRSMGIQTVAVYSDADADSPYLSDADEAYSIGPPPARDSYLKGSEIIALATETEADAIHPGYGFLSENPDFAQACIDAGIAFIGPCPGAIRSMGKKVQARELMQSAGIPIIHGSRTPLSSVQEALEVAGEIGYPVLLKASGGGGGIGMEVVDKVAKMETLFDRCQSRAKACFGDEAIYIEKYLDSPRHIEIQIIADHHGNVWHLGERDCSVQRRNQKVIEESPSVAITEETRKSMCDIAVRAAAAIGYDSIGTIEMLLDSDNKFYFLEMNTRIQVEHGVTELRTGYDLVELQIRAAAGETLEPKEYRPVGHSMECRIYAENPLNFRPSCGLLEDLNLPTEENLRIDHSIRSGLKLSPFYDPLIAKVMVWAPERTGCIQKISRCLNATQITGISTNIPFLLRVLGNLKFAETGATTDLTDEILRELQAA